MSDVVQRPSVEVLRSMFDYRDGMLFYKAAPKARRKSGDRAGSLDAGAGRRIIKIGGVRLKEHMVVWAVVHGEWPASLIDHIDGNPKNNRIENLRVASREVNAQNRRGPSKANTSGFLGVYWSDRRGGFMASIKQSGRQTRRGPFDDPGAAYEAYLQMKRKYHEGCTL